MKACNVISFWLLTQDFFLEKLLREDSTRIVANPAEVFEDDELPTSIG